MSRLLKQPGWERRLVAWAEYTVGQPFKWGVTDCASLVADAIHAMTLSLTGQHAKSGVRGYSTRLGARRADVKTGGIRQHLRSLGLREVDVRFCQQGDIIVTPRKTTREMEHAMVVVSGMLLDSRETEGSAVRWAPLSEARVPGSVALRI